MNQVERKKIEETIKMLQEMLGEKSGSGSGAAAKVNIPGFDQEISNFANIGQKLEPEIKELTSIVTESIGLMQEILNYSEICKAPNDNEKKTMQEKFMTITNRIDNVEKNQNFVFHAKAVREIVSVPFWVFTNSPEFIIKGGIESADFHALKFMKLKNQNHNDWWKSLGRACRILEDFTKKEYAMGLNYNGQGSGSWSHLISGSQLQTQVQQPQNNSPQQIIAPQQKVVAPKAPKRELQGFNWLISNFKNEKITFAPGEVEMKNGIFIENCKDCVITIDSKFKSLSMNNSFGIVLIVQSCVSGVEVMNGDNIQVYVKGHSPSVSIEKCQKVRVVLNDANMNCDVLTCKVTEVNVSYEKDGNEAKNFMVAEQLLTKWNPNKNKFETVIYDKFL